MEIELDNNESEIYKEWVVYNQNVNFNEFMNTYIDNMDLYYKNIPDIECYKFKWFLKNRECYIEDIILNQDK